jgi:5-methyltetrahydrofolate--homocysteine methyltransferase
MTKFQKIIERVEDVILNRRDDATRLLPENKGDVKSNEKAIQEWRSGNYSGKTDHSLVKELMNLFF